MEIQLILIISLVLIITGWICSKGKLLRFLINPMECLEFALQTLGEVGTLDSKTALQIMFTYLGLLAIPAFAISACILLTS